MGWAASGRGQARATVLASRMGFRVRSSRSHRAFRAAEQGPFEEGKSVPLVGSRTLRPSASAISSLAWVVVAAGPAKPQRAPLHPLQFLHPLAGRLERGSRTRAAPEGRIANDAEHEAQRSGVPLLRPLNGARDDPLPDRSFRVRERAAPGKRRARSTRSSRTAESSPPCRRRPSLRRAEGLLARRPRSRSHDRPVDHQN